MWQWFKDQVQGNFKFLEGEFKVAESFSGNNTIGIAINHMIHNRNSIWHNTSPASFCF